MGRMRTLIIFAVVAFVVALVLPGRTMAQQGKVIELTYGSPYGPDHTFSKTDKKWIAKIEKETNGRVKIKPFWGGAIIGGGSDAMDEVVKGVADIGFVSPGQARSGYEFAKANFLFFSNASIANVRPTFMEVLKKFPEMEKEYKGLKVMAWSSGTEYELLTRKPVRKLADMKGMRVKTLGEIVNVLKDLGVEGMSSPMSEVYVSMQKGILDGAFVTDSTLKVMRFAEVAKYMTTLNVCRAPVGNRVMSLTAWNKLPPDIQKVFENNIEYWGSEADKDVMNDDLEGKEFGKKNGVQYIDLPKEDMTRFYGLVMEDAAKAAKTLDGKGLPGTKVFTEAQNLIKASKK